MKALVVIGSAAAGAGAVWLGTKLVRRMSLRGLGAAGSVADAAAVHLRQIRRYAFASSQDTSPIVGLTHASYALILLDTLEEVAGREAVNKTGMDPKRIREFITKLQDKHAEALQACDGHLQQVLAIERGEGNQLPGFVVAGYEDGYERPFFTGNDAWAAPRGA